MVVWGNLPLKVARPPRIERGTTCLEGRCSIQLSYGRNESAVYGVAVHYESIGESGKLICRRA